MKKCVIVGAMPAENIITDKDTLVIAADAGIINLERCGIEPDIIIGDFDSLGSIPKGDNVITYPKEKDDTDTMLAVKKGMEKGADEFYIYGGTGGRLDHTIANIQSLAYIAKKGGRGYILDKETCITVIKDSGITIKAHSGNDLSVFAFGGSAQGVCLKGLKYEVNDVVLTPCFPLGVSNSFKEKEAVISVKKGMLCIIWKRSE